MRDAFCVGSGEWVSYSEKCEIVLGWNGNGHEFWIVGSGWADV